MDSSERYKTLVTWVECLENVSKEFPGENTCIGTAIKSFKAQIKELEKRQNNDS